MLSLLNDMIIRQAIGDTLIFTFPIFVDDLDKDENSIIYANQKLEVLFGYQVLGEVKGQSVEFLIAPQKRDQHRAFRAEYRKNPEILQMGRRRKLFGWHKSQYEFPVEIILVPRIIEGGQQFRCVVGLIFDLSARQGSDSSTGIFLPMKSMNE